MKRTILLVVAFLGLLFLVFEGLEIGEDLAAPEGIGQVVEPARGDELAAPGADPVVLSGKDESGERNLGRSSLDEQEEGQRGAVESAGLGGLMGRVVDLDLKPIGGAAVSAVAAPSGFSFLEAGTVREPKQTAHTDEKGRFHLKGLGQGNIELEIHAQGFLHLSESVYLEAGTSFDFGNLVLDPGYALRGRVLSFGGAPLEGVSVYLVPPSEPGVMSFAFQQRKGTEIALTDQDGDFAVSCLAIGPYELKFSRSDLLDAQESGVIQQGNEDVLDVRMESGATLSGRVEGSDVPLSDLSVVAWSPMLGTPKIRMTGINGGGPSPFDRKFAGEVVGDGTFLVQGLPRDAQVRAAVFYTDNQFTPLGPDVEAESGDQGVVLGFFPSMNLSLHLVSAGTGGGIEEFGIWAGCGEVQPLEDENGAPLHHHAAGYVEFVGLPIPSSDARLTVRIDAPGYAPFLRTDIVPNPQGKVDLGKIALVRAPGLRVRVVDAITGVPLQGVRVRAMEVPTGTASRRIMPELGMSFSEMGLPGGPGIRRSKVTDEAGDVQFAAAVGSSSRMTINEDGYAQLEQTLRVTQADIVHEARLVRPCTVEVTLLDSQGQPKVAGRVQHRSEDGGMGAEFFLGGFRRTDAKGMAVFRSLQPGTHRFRVSKVGANQMVTMIQTFDGGKAPEEAPWETVTLVPGETQSVTLREVQKSIIRGRVFLDGRPLAQCRVTFNTRGVGMFFLGGGAPSNMTSGDGSFEIKNLDPGEGQLSFAHPSLVMGHQQDYTCVLGEQVVDVDLVLTTVTGRVSGTDGRGIEGADVAVSGGESSGAMLGKAIMISGSGGSGAQVVSSFGGAASVRTKEDGSYVLSGVLAGVPLTIEASGKGMKPVSLEIDPIDQGTTVDNVDMVLQLGSSLVITRTPMPGEMHLLVKIQWKGAQPESGPNQTERGFMIEGSCRFEGLAPGQWEVSLKEMGRPDGAALIEPRTIELRAGEEHELSLD